MGVDRGGGGWGIYPPNILGGGGLYYHPHYFKVECPIIQTKYQYQQK